MVQRLSWLFGEVNSCSAAKSGVFVQACIKKKVSKFNYKSYTQSLIRISKKALGGKMLHTQRWSSLPCAVRSLT